MSTEQHKNDFTFDIPGLTAVGFQLVDYSISEGQESTWGGVKCDGNTVIVYAGRHKTKPVAKWFNNATAGGGGIALTYADTTPDELNFAVRGTLTLQIGGVTYTAQNFLLAQGSAKSGDNNWWLGSPQMSDITHSNVTQEYAIEVTKKALSFVSAIVTDDPEGAIKATADLIVFAVKKHKVGSGQVPFTMSSSGSSVELLLFQMADNHLTQGQLTGTYSAPN